MRRTWDIDDASGRHRVAASLNAWTSGLTIWVDEVVAMKRNLTLDAMARHGADVAFALGGQPATMHVRTGGLRNVLELSVADRPIDWRAPITPMPQRTPPGLPELIDWAMVPAVLGTAMPLTRIAGLPAFLLMLASFLVVHRFGRVPGMPAWARIVGSIAIFVGWLALSFLVARAIVGPPA
jgi:hypothetical protein